MIAYELLGVDDGGRAESMGKANFVLLAESLIAQENDQVVVPGGKNLRKCLVVDFSAQIDTTDLCT
jgi:hypothetical protein